MFAGASRSATGALAKVPPEVLDKILAEDLHVADHLAISWTCGFFRKIYSKDTLIVSRAENGRPETPEAPEAPAYVSNPLSQALAPDEYQKFRSPEEKIADARRRVTIDTSYLKSLDVDPAVQAIGLDNGGEGPAVDTAHAHIPYSIMRRRMEDSVAAWLKSTVGKQSEFGQCPAFSASASLDQTRAWLISTVATRHITKMQAMERFQVRKIGYVRYSLERADSMGRAPVR